MTRAISLRGIEQAGDLGTTVFHAGTELHQKQLVTDGGRVLNVTGVGENIEQAIAHAYAGLECIHFQGVYYRRDIGYRVRGIGGRALSVWSEEQVKVVFNFLNLIPYFITKVVF